MRKIVFTLILLCGIVWSASTQVNKHYFVWAGRDMIRESRHREAIETLNILLNADPEAYEGYFWRGIAKYNLNDLLGAEQDFTNTLDKNPVYTTAYQFRAMTRARLGNYDDALRDFKEAIDLRPDYQAPYFSRGVAYIITKQYDKAIADFDTYLLYNIRDADAYANRGTAYLNLRDTTAAMDDFNRSIRYNRDYPRGYVERGALHLAQKNYDLAIADFDSAIKCDSTYTVSYFNRSMAHYGKKSINAALADLGKVIKLEPSSSVAYFNRALLRIETGDYNRALDDYNKASLLSPDNVLIYYNRAILHRTLGELKPALKDYDRAIELLPDFTAAYMGRSEVKYLLRDVAGAERDRNTAQRKIAEYKSLSHNDDNLSRYADTTQNFSRLLSFDTRMGASTARSIKATENQNISLRPLYKFTLRKANPDNSKSANGISQKRLNDFLTAASDPRIVFSPEETNFTAEELVAQNDKASEAVIRSPDKWPPLFRRSITQSSLKQYTNAINGLSSAIELNPANPFLYIARSAVRAEMTDFIASMDGEGMRISLESDGNERHNGTPQRTYDYDEAISDLNKAAKLYPELAYIYYNRANLNAVSGNFTEAERDYSQMLSLDNTFADAYFNRGLVRIYMKKMREGLIDISKAGELGIADAYNVMQIYSPQVED